MDDLHLRIDPRADLDVKTSVNRPSRPGTFEVLAHDPESHARVGRLWTAHGPVATPCFMPVGTYGAIKGLVPDEVEAVGSQIILANAYHLTHRPGVERIQRFGGLHAMMGWSGPILTDSGGYQVFSLRGLQRIDEDGVDYRTHFDGSKHRMTPRSVLEVQARLGSDICMVLDHCPPGQASPQAVHDAVDRSTRWAREAAELRSEILAPDQLCFGIVQGGTDLALRRAHLDVLGTLGFDGLALGGLSVGEPVSEMHRVLRQVAPQMPADRPRYVMGIGTPADLLVAMLAGVDMFDCVIPTRHARNGQMFTLGGRINIRQAQYRDDGAPVDPDCACFTCQRFSRAYLRHLHEQGDPLYGRLATLHNLYFFHGWVASVRQAIRAGRLAALAQQMSRMVATPETGLPGVEPA